MESDVVTESREGARKEPYHEPLLIKHEPLRDITGQKYDLEKNGIENEEISQT